MKNYINKLYTIIVYYFYQQKIVFLVKHDNSKLSIIKFKNNVLKLLQLLHILLKCTLQLDNNL